MQLRDYQMLAYLKTTSALREHDSSLLVLPTGMGKTEVFVRLAQDWDRGRVLVVAPMIELVGQAAKKIQKRTGDRVAIEQGKLRSCEYEWGRAQYIVASKQTLCGATKRYERLQDIGLVIVDECHLAATETYAEMLDHFKRQGAKVVGVTATPSRNDGRAMGQLFDSCAYQLGIREAIDEGWLVSARTSCIQIESLDLSEVGTKGARGDFREGELARVMEDDRVVFEIAEVVARESAGLKTVVFTASVLEAQAVADLLADSHGVDARWVCGDKRLCSEADRASILTSFTKDPNGVQIVCNVGVLTTGWDFPGLQHIVMARPTKSLTLFTQIFGRGTRPLEGVVDFFGSTPESRRAAIAASSKPHFKFTDLADNSMEHRIVTAVDVLGGEQTLVERSKKKPPAEGEPTEEMITKHAKDIQREAGKAGEARSLDEILAEARERAKEQAEQEAAGRARRAAIRADARYTRISVDPLDGDAPLAARAARAPSKARFPFGKYRGEPVSSIPTSYLNWCCKEGVLRVEWLRGAVYGELAKRKQGEPRGLLSSEMDRIADEIVSAG